MGGIFEGEELLECIGKRSVSAFLAGLLRGQRM